jgi:hypothetical protein
MPGQRSHSLRFGDYPGTVCQDGVVADVKVRAKYEKTAAKQGKRAFDLAVSDFFHGKNLLVG